jgi:hypothetical protein
MFRAERRARRRSGGRAGGESRQSPFVVRLWNHRHRRPFDRLRPSGPRCSTWNVLRRLAALRPQWSRQSPFVVTLRQAQGNHERTSVPTRRRWDAASERGVRPSTRSGRAEPRCSTWNVLRPLAALPAAMVQPESVRGDPSTGSGEPRADAGVAGSVLSEASLAPWRFRESAWSAVQSRRIRASFFARDQPFT